MGWAPMMYVDRYGREYGASRTDQRGSRTTEGRTVNGEPVVCIGLWWPSQMGYQPYRDAVAAGRDKLAMPITAEPENDHDQSARLSWMSQDEHACWTCGYPCDCGEPVDEECHECWYCNEERFDRDIRESDSEDDDDQT